jgi:hypothetical protein
MSAIQQARKSDDDPITPVYRLPIDHTSAWKPADFTSSADHTIDLTASQLRDADHTIANVKAAGLEVPGMRVVYPHIRRNGIAAVPGRTPSYNWSRLTKN